MKKQFSIFLSVLAGMLAIMSPAAAQNGATECGNGTVTVAFTAPGNLTDFTCLTVPTAERAPDGQPLTAAKLESAAVVFNQLRTANPISPELTVFPVSGLSAVNPEIYQKAVDLTALINSVATNGIAAVTGDIPVLPLQEKPQLMSALPTVLTPQGINGLRFLTAFDDASAGVTNNNIVYAFQGLSVDGRNIVSVLFPIQHSALTAPATAPREYNWAALPEDGWTPRLSDLDEIIKSITLR